MKLPLLSRQLLILVLGWSFVVGCDGQAVKRPTVDPAAAAEQAIAAYDADGDGAISKDEAKKSALSPDRGWDQDGDGSIDQAEIENRLTTYDAMKPGLQLNITCRVLKKRKPLEGAEVVYEPEAFLGEAIPPARGITGPGGNADIVSDEISDPSLRGVHTGLYLVRITHPTEEIPAKYNTETELFVELSPMDMQHEVPTFQIK